MPVAARLVAEIEADITGLKAGVAAAEAMLMSLQKKTGTVGSSGANALSGIAASATSLGAKLNNVGLSLTFGLGMPLAAVGKSSLEAAMKIDSLERGLTAVMGSAEKSAKELKRLYEVSRLPGIDFPGAVEGSLRLQAVHMSADKAARTLKTFANAVALGGGSSQQLNSAMYQLAQVMGAGKFQGDELRVMIDAMPMLRRVLIDTFGTSTGKEISKQGTVDQILDKILIGLEKMPKVTAGPKVLMENLTSDVTMALAKLGMAIFPVLEKLINIGLPILNQLVDAFVKLPEPVKNAIVVLGMIGAVIGPLLLMVGSLVTAFGFIAEALSAVAAPVAIVVAAVVALGAAFASNFLGIRDMVMQVAKYLGDAFNIISDGMKYVFKEVWPDVVAAFNEISATLAPVFQEIQREFMKAFGDIVKWTQNHWPEIKLIIQVVLLSIVETIKFTVAMIRSLWSMFGEDLVTVIRSAWQIISGVFQAASAYISGVIEVVANLLEGRWDKAFEAAVRSVANAHMGIQNAMMGIQNSVFAVLRAIIGSVIAAGMQMYSAAVNLGNQLIRGVINSVSKGIASVHNAVTNLANSAINAAKSALQIKSPSREFFAIGTQVVAGLVNGIQASVPAAYLKSHEMLKAMVDMAKAAAEEYKDSIKTLKDAYQDELVGIKLLLATDAQHRTSLQLLKKDYEALDKTQKSLIDNIVGLKEIAEALSKPLLSGFEDTYQSSGTVVGRASKFIKDALGAHKMATDAQAKIDNSISEAMRKSNIELQKALGTWTSLDQVLEGLGLKWDQLSEAQKGAVMNIVATNKELEEFQLKLKLIEDFNTKINEMATNLSDVLINAFDDGFENGFSKFFVNVISGFKRMLLNMALEYLKSRLVQLFSGLLGGIMGGGKGGGSSIMNMIVNPPDFAAAGGNTNPGVPLIVGERGPELFMPNALGRIISNHQLQRFQNNSGGSWNGGTTNTTQNQSIVYAPVYHINTPNPEAFKKSQKQIMIEGSQQFRDLQRRY